MSAPVLEASTTSDLDQLLAAVDSLIPQSILKEKVVAADAVDIKHPLAVNAKDDDDSSSHQLEELLAIAEGINSSNLVQKHDAAAYSDQYPAHHFPGGESNAHNYSHNQQQSSKVAPEAAYRQHVEAYRRSSSSLYNVASDYIGAALKCPPSGSAAWPPGGTHPCQPWQVHAATTLPPPVDEVSSSSSVHHHHKRRESTHLQHNTHHSTQSDGRRRTRSIDPPQRNQHYQSSYPPPPHPRHPARTTSNTRRDDTTRRDDGHGRHGSRRRSRSRSPATTTRRRRREAERHSSSRSRDYNRRQQSPATSSKAPLPSDRATMEGISDFDISNLFKIICKK